MGEAEGVWRDDRNYGLHGVLPDPPWRPSLLHPGQSPKAPRATEAPSPNWGSRDASVACRGSCFRALNGDATERFPVGKGDCLGGRLDQSQWTAWNKLAVRLILDADGSVAWTDTYDLNLNATYSIEMETKVAQQIAIAIAQRTIPRDGVSEAIW